MVQVQAEVRPGSRGLTLLVIFSRGGVGILGLIVWFARRTANWIEADLSKYGVSVGCGSGREGFCV